MADPETTSSAPTSAPEPNWTPPVADGEVSDIGGALGVWSVCRTGG
jgi:hypothetical protein